MNLTPIGHVHSSLQALEQAPRQGDEGAPEAWLHLEPAYLDATLGLKAGMDLFVLTWLHHARRDAQQVHPRNEALRPLTGVFATRSQDRPNPIGLHRVKLLEVSGPRLKVGPMEAIDGTPVVDIKVVLEGEGR